jgi:cytochrome c-type biogenesis protein CcmH
VIRALAAAWVVVLLAAAAAAASEKRPTLEELERELICPTCNTTLAMSQSPVADRMRAFIRERIAAGDTKAEIKEQLVAEFGEEVLAAPPKRGFNVLAWVVPLVGGGVGVIGLGVLARRWRRGRAEITPADPSANGRAPLDPDLEQRIDEELARFEA